MKGLAMINLEELNAIVSPLRKEITRIILFGGLGGLIFLMIILTNLSGHSSSLIPLMILIFIYIFIISALVGGARSRYAQKVKLILSDQLFKPQFENYSFQPNTGFDRSIVKQLDILPTGDSYNSNDLMKGTLHDVAFTRADVHTTTTTTDSEGHSSTTTNFRGQIYAFDFFKNSNSYLRIRDRSFSKFGRGRKVEGSSHIKFEDGAFNDMFRCYSNNDHEAFYLFTPHFMQKLMDFRTKLGLHFSLVIHNSMLYLAIYSNTDSFEPSIWNDIDQSYLNSVQKDIDIITTIIDDLDLKTTLFK